MDTILLKVQLLALQSTQEGNSDTPSLPGGNEAFFHPIWQLLHLWHKNNKDRFWKVCCQRNLLVAYARVANP